METGDNIIHPRDVLTRASSAPKQGVRGFWGAQDLAELYRVADHLTRLGLPVVVCTGKSDEGDPWAVFERQSTGDVVVHVARIDTGLVIVDVARDRVYSGADFRAVANQLMADVVLVAPPPRHRGNVVVHPRMAMMTFVAAALVAASLADPASASSDTSSDVLPPPDLEPDPDDDTDSHVDQQDAMLAPVFPSDSLPVMPWMSRASEASIAGCAVVDSPVLPRSEPSERLTGRDIHGMSAAMSYGGMGMGVTSIGLTTLAIHLAPPLLLDTPDRSGGRTMPEEELLTWVLPSPNGDMQRLLSAPADITFGVPLNHSDRSAPSKGQGSIPEQSMEAASVHPDGTALTAAALQLARPVDTAAHTIFLESPIETEAVAPAAPKPLPNAVSATTPASSETSVAQVAPLNSSNASVRVDAPAAVSDDKSVFIFDHVVASTWDADRIALLGFDAETADGGPDGMTGGAIVVQMRREQIDMHANGAPDELPEDTLTVAWPTAVPDVAADADAQLMSPEAYVLADTLSNHVTLADDATNVVVYIAGVVTVEGFTLGRDRIVMVEDAAEPDWLSSVDIAGQDIVLMGLDGDSVTLFGAAVAFV